MRSLWAFQYSIQYIYSISTKSENRTFAIGLTFLLKLQSNILFVCLFFFVKFGKYKNSMHIRMVKGLTEFLEKHEGKKNTCNGLRCVALRCVVCGLVIFYLKGRRRQTDMLTWPWRIQARQQLDPDKGRHGLFMEEGRGPQVRTIRDRTNNETQVKLIRVERHATPTRWD